MTSPSVIPEQRLTRPRRRAMVSIDPSEDWTANEGMMADEGVCATRQVAEGLCSLGLLRCVAGSWNDEYGYTYAASPAGIAWLRANGWSRHREAPDAVE